MDANAGVPDRASGGGPVIALLAMAAALFVGAFLVGYALGRWADE